MKRTGIPKLDDTSLTGRVSAIPPHYRRLDILAEMLETSDQAASVCFDGENLLFACNSVKRNDLQLRLLSHLTVITNIDYSADNWQEKFDSAHDKLMALATGFYTQHAGRRRSGIFLSEDWLSEFENNLKRVEGSIIASIAITNPSILESVESKFSPEFTRIDATFKPELIEALKQGKILNLDESKNKIHAELRIIDKLFTDNKIQNRKKFYISTSKKCCVNCEHVIKAVNEVFLAGGSPTLETRDLRTEGHGHGVTYGKSDLPRFLTNSSKLSKVPSKTREEIIAAFLISSGKSSIQSAFKDATEHKNVGRLQRMRSDSPTSRWTDTIGKSSSSDELTELDSPPASKAKQKSPGHGSPSSEDLTDLEDYTPQKNVATRGKRGSLSDETLLLPPKMSEDPIILSPRHINNRSTILRHSTGMMTPPNSKAKKILFSQSHDTGLSSQENAAPSNILLSKDITKGLKKVSLASANKTETRTVIPKKRTPLGVHTGKS